MAPGATALARLDPRLSRVAELGTGKTASRTGGARTDIEHRIMIAMLATEHDRGAGADRLSRDGSYSDMAIMLSSRRALVNGLRLLMRRWSAVRWRTCRQLSHRHPRSDAKGLPLHNADFRGYYYGDDRRTMPTASCTHRTA